MLLSSGVALPMAGDNWEERHTGWRRREKSLSGIPLKTVREGGGAAGALHAAGWAAIMRLQACPTERGREGGTRKKIGI